VSVLITRVLYEPQELHLWYSQWNRHLPFFSQSLQSMSWRGHVVKINKNCTGLHNEKKNWTTWHRSRYSSGSSSAANNASSMPKYTCCTGKMNYESNSVWSLAHSRIWTINSDNHHYPHDNLRILIDCLRSVYYQKSHKKTSAVFLLQHVVTACNLRTTTITHATPRQMQTDWQVCRTRVLNTEEYTSLRVNTK